MMNTTKSYLSVAAITLLFAACKKNDPTPPPSPAPVSKVVAVGDVSGTPSARIAVWENGTEKFLTDGSKIAISRSVAIDKDFNYVCGFHFYNGLNNPGYWKGTERIDMPATGINGQGFGDDIEVEGSNIYFMAQSEYQGHRSVIKWVNGAREVWYRDPNYDCSASDMAVAGGIPHAVVNVGNIGDTVSGVGYLKGSAFTMLTDMHRKAKGAAICLSGSDVLIAGSRAAANGKRIPILWKNGVASALADSANVGMALGMCVSGSDVYIAGSYNGQAVYWKNGVMNAVPGAGAESSAVEIAVLGSDVYIAYNQGSNGYLLKNGQAVWTFAGVIHGVKAGQF